MSSDIYLQFIGFVTDFHFDHFASLFDLIASILTITSLFQLKDTHLQIKNSKSKGLFGKNVVFGTTFFKGCITYPRLHPFQ